MARRALERTVGFGEIWMYAFGHPDKPRPVLVLTHPDLLPHLTSIIVASITRTIRGSAAEVVLGMDEGLKDTCCVSLVNVFTIPKRELYEFRGRVTPQKMILVCQALQRATGCSG